MHAEPRHQLLNSNNVDDDGWFDALYLHLHRVACVAAPTDVDPDDLVQDALVNYLSLGDPVSVRGRRRYLTTTVMNLASNHRRSWVRRRRAVARLGREDRDLDDYPPDVDDLERLPPRERNVLYLRYIDGLAYEEVAALVGCTATAARKAAQRGRTRLAGLVREDEK